MVEENAIVYTVQVNGHERKAFDAIALKQFLEGQKLNYSVLSLDPEDLNGEDINFYIAKAAVATLKELESAIDESLGLVSPPSVSEDSEKITEVKETPRPVPKEPIVIESNEETEVVENEETEEVIEL